MTTITITEQGTITITLTTFVHPRTIKIITTEEVARMDQVDGPLQAAMDARPWHREMTCGGRGKYCRSIKSNDPFDDDSRKLIFCQSHVAARRAYNKSKKELYHKRFLASKAADNWRILDGQRKDLAKTRKESRTMLLNRKRQ